MVSPTYRPRTQYANKHWGCGRLKQLLVRSIHKQLSHHWSTWNVEPPEDELGRFLSPEPDTVVFCFRGCLGDCGAVQHTLVRFDQHGSLPR